MTHDEPDPGGRATGADGRLLNRDFVLLWQGLFLNQVGLQTLLIALLLWFKERTDSATDVALIMAAATLPRLLLGPLGGALADRHPRRLLVIGADGVRAVVVLALALFLWHAPSHALALTGGVGLALGVLGAGGAVYTPAAMALLPDVVPAKRLPRGNSLLQGTVQGTTLIAQGLAGLLYTTVGAPFTALMAAASYAAAAVSEIWIRTPPHAPSTDTPSRSGWLRETVQGFDYLRRQSGLRTLFVIVGLVNFLLGPLVALLPFYVERSLHREPAWFGFLLASLSAGALAGYALAGGLSAQGRSRATWRHASLLLIAPALGLLGLAEGTLPALVATFAIGLLDGFIYVEAVSLLQSQTPSDMRGRVLALFRTVIDGGTPIAATLAGLVIDRTALDIGSFFLASSLGLAVACLAAVTRAPLRTCLSSG